VVAEARAAAVIRRIDPLSRTAYGVLCIAAMSLLAIPVLFSVGVMGGIIIALDGNGDRAVAVWLGAWGASFVAFVLFLVTAYLFWPFASDWILEWQGYLLGIIIGAIGLAVMAVFVIISPWPLAIEVLVPLAGTFVAGFILPGRFLGLKRNAAQSRARRPLARHERQ
jgi:hypothetical protein